MPIKYSKEELLSKIKNAANDMSLFYSKGFVNWTGRTSDTNEYYTEIISEWLLENLEVLDSIYVVFRSESYKRKSHNCSSLNNASNRVEEQIAMKLRLQERVMGLGSVIDYQIPLKDSNDNNSGKIDLLSYDENSKTLFILELKRKDSNESMLRCVIEGYTYLKTVDIPKLIRDFDLPKDTKVVSSPLVFENGSQHQEMMMGRPMLEQLMNKLDCFPLYLREDNGKYIVVNELEYKN